MKKLIDQMQEQAKAAKLPNGRFIECREQGVGTPWLGFIPDGVGYDNQAVVAGLVRWLERMKDKDGEPIYRTHDEAWWAAVKIATICADALNEALEKEKTTIS